MSPDRPAGLARLGLAALLVLGMELVERSAAAGADRSQRAHLLLVTIDTWRGDYLGAVSPSRVATPHLDALAREGMLFTNTRVPAPITLVTHASLLTGLEPPAHGVRNNGGFALGDEHRTLAEALESTARGGRPGRCAVPHATPRQRRPLLAGGSRPDSPGPAATGGRPGPRGGAGPAAARRGAARSARSPARPRR